MEPIQTIEDINKNIDIVLSIWNNTNDEDLIDWCINKYNILNEKLNNFICLSKKEVKQENV